MKILIASSISPEAIAELKKNHEVKCVFNATEEQLKTLITDREVLIFRSGVSVTSEVMAKAPRLALLIRAGSGVDNIDLDYAARRDIRLERIPEPGARAVAELCFALMLSLARKILPADRMLRSGNWVKNDIQGFLLHDKVLGIVGAGNIGSMVGEMAARWGMKVYGCVRTPSPSVAKQLSQRNIILTDFHEVVNRADFLSLHVPLSASTRNLINSTVFTRMKRGAFLINLARGGVLNEKDLHNAMIYNGKISGAALDVHEMEGNGRISPLASLPNVILTPHIGAQTIDSQQEIGDKILMILKSYETEMQEGASEKAA